MLWWILGALVLAALFGLVLAAAAGPPAEAESERMLRLRRQARDEVEAEYEKFLEEKRIATRDAKRYSVHVFENTSLKGWPFKRCKIGSNRAAIGFNPDCSTFVVVHYKDDKIIHIVREDEYQLSKVSSVSIKQMMKSRSDKIVDYATVEVRKNKNAIGRGVAGAIVAGPVGAIVGAVSAVTPTATTERVATVRHETTTSKGDSRVTVCWSDMSQKPINFDFALESDAEAVAAWMEVHSVGRPLAPFMVSDTDASEMGPGHRHG